MKRPKPDWDWMSVTEEQRQLAIRRAAWLSDGIGANLAMKDLLANAYLCGVYDAAEVMAMRAERAA